MPGLISTEENKIIRKILIPVVVLVHMYYIIQMYLLPFYHL
ncbi:ER6-like protein [Schistosoma mansoni]|nr:ER6-like protein [Schistosoma mansoni]|eukprot:XP_018652398.1 ER6-like protein [Schistosoma mansoni]